MLFLCVSQFMIFSIALFAYITYESSYVGDNMQKDRSIVADRRLPHRARSGDDVTKVQRCLRGGQ